MEFKIEKLVKDQDGGVVSVSWSMTAGQGSSYIKDHGVSKFKPNPNDPSFIPFDRLVESDVVSWVSQKVNPLAVQERLSNNSIETLILEAELPWVSSNI